jgi:hypothetical protein
MPYPGKLLSPENLISTSTGNQIYKQKKITIIKLNIIANMRGADFICSSLCLAQQPY